MKSVGEKEYILIFMFLFRLDEEYQSLTIEPSSSVIERTSKEWLKAYSLKSEFESSNGIP